MTYVLSDKVSNWNIKYVIVSLSEISNFSYESEILIKELFEELKSRLEEHYITKYKILVNVNKPNSWVFRYSTENDYVIDNNIGEYILGNQKLLEFIRTNNIVYFESINSHV